jgi:hypothetical protein
VVLGIERKTLRNDFRFPALGRTPRQEFTGHWIR